MSHNPATPPDASDPSGPCPRCTLISSFHRATSTNLKRDGSEQVSVYQCQGCQDWIAVVERRLSTNPLTWEGIHWWPIPGAGNLDPAIPPVVVSAFTEGMQCLLVKANRAAAIMFRAMLEQIVKNIGSAQANAAGTLSEKLKQMEIDHALHPTLVTWANNIPLIGNAAAYNDPLDPVTDEDATSLANLSRYFLDVVYETPAKISRSQP